METKKSSVMHIKFHNPNSSEATAKRLTEVIAENLVNQALRGSLGEAASEDSAYRSKEKLPK